VQTAPAYSQSGGTIKRCGSDLPAICSCRSESRPPGAQHRCAPTIPHHSPFFSSRLATRCSPSFTIRHSLLATRHSLLAARRSPCFTIRYSLFAIRRIFHSPFAVFFSFPRASRPGRWVSTNGSSPTHPRTVGARHAVLLPFATHGSVCTSGLGLRGGRTVCRQDAGATTQPGRVWDPPLPGPAPFTIRDSLFAIRRLFLFTIRYSRFAIRRLSPLAARRRSPSATPYALLAVFLHSHSLSAPSQASPMRSRLSPAQGVVAGSKRERLRALDKHAVLPVQSASII
jgi:hypothetical protein